ncbi:MAG: DUF3429 domain-containing protein [Ideonella sp. MAG2]|nr:MAG: DUF3429 domain-containing protein [Ideonella sp. MAG2]
MNTSPSPDSTSLDIVLPDEPPLWASRMGHAGLIPFVLLSLLVWVVWPDVQPDVTLAFSAYAATIVAFLGGVHWGLAMRAEGPGPRAFRWAVVPPLLAWVGAIMPPHAGLVWLGAALVLCYLVDRRLYLACGQAHWLTLRFRLSAVAALSCFLGAAGI